MRIHIAVLILAFAVACPAQECVWFYASGGGDLCANPPVFVGSVLPGGDLDVGSWSIVVDDSGWPADPEERQDFLWEYYFAPNYTRETSFEGNYWIADFCIAAPGLPVSAMYGELFPLEIYDASNGGSLVGRCSVQQWIGDANENGVLDSGEAATGMLWVPYIIIEGGTGCYAGSSGTGYACGPFVMGTAPSGLDLDWYPTFLLWLDFYSPRRAPYLADVRGSLRKSDLPVSWGAIKALYR